MKNEKDEKKKGEGKEDIYSLRVTDHARSRTGGVTP